MNADEFIAAARSMLGVKFKHQGRHETAGVDCAGLAVCASKKCGFNPVDKTNYTRSPGYSDLVPILLQSGKLVPFGEEKRGDIWVFKIRGEPQHIAIQTEDESDNNRARMIHSYAVMRMVVEHDIDDFWRSSRHAVVRFTEE